MDEQRRITPHPSGESLPPSPHGEGYRRGYEDGVRELARRLENYYKWLGGSKTIGYTVEFTIKEKVKDILGGE